MKGDFEIKGFKINLWKTKVIISRRITKDGLSKVKLTNLGSAA